MRLVLGIVLLAATAAFAQQRPAEIDPNTKIEGGADPRGSGARAGAQPRANPETDARPQGREVGVEPQKIDPKEDRPISARKPQDVDRERAEDAAKGETSKRQ